MESFCYETDDHYYSWEMYVQLPSNHLFQLKLCFDVHLFINLFTGAQDLIFNLEVEEPLTGAKFGGKAPTLLSRILIRKDLNASMQI